MHVIASIINMAQRRLSHETLFQLHSYVVLDHHIEFLRLCQRFTLILLLCWKISSAKIGGKYEI